MKKFYPTILFFSLLITSLTPSKIFAQDSYTITSTGDLGAWDDPDTEADESMDGICDDGSGMCTLRAAIEEAVNREASVYINFGISGIIPTAGDFPGLPDGSSIIGPNGNITINSTTDGFNGGDNITITNII